MALQFTTEDFAALGGHQLGYLRPVKAEDVLGDASLAFAPDFSSATPDQTFFALHGADGESLAVLMDRDSAMAAARANDMALMAVH